MTKQQFFRFLRRITSLLIFGIFVGIIWYQRESIGEALTRVSLVHGVLIFVSLCLMYASSAAAWQQILSGLGSHLPYRAVLAIWVTSNSARYIPGTIWQFLGRVFFAGEHGISRTRTLVSILYEIALLLIAALTVITLSLPFWPVVAPLPWWFALVAVGALTILWPVTLPGLVQFLGRLQRTPLEEVPVLPWQYLLRAYLLTVLRVVAGGLGFWVLSSLFVSFSPLELLGVLGMYALAWLIGYVTVFAPAGVGVADGTLIGLFASRLNAVQSLSVVVIFRAFLIIAELLVLLVAFGFHPLILAHLTLRRQRLNQGAEDGAID